MSEIACDICEQPAKQVANPRSDAAYTVECLGCGNYYVSDMWRAAKMARVLKPDERIRLRGVVRRDTDERGRCGTVVNQESFRRLMTRHDEPAGPLEQMERLLLIAAERAPHFGADAKLEPDATIARLYLPLGGTNVLPEILRGMARAGYIEPTGSSPYECRLSFKGWELAQSLRRARAAGSQAFVAMWFSPTMDAALDTGFAPALRACGYVPHRVDQAVHNNKIDDQIVASIRKSRLLVADLTGMRPNVFYEAGLAHGLGMPLLLTCREDAFEDISKHAFDLRQYPVLSWSRPEDLASKLQNRIEALAWSLVPGRAE